MPVSLPIKEEEKEKEGRGGREKKPARLEKVGAVTYLTVNTVSVQTLLCSDKDIFMDRL